MKDYNIIIFTLSCGMKEVKSRYKWVSFVCRTKKLEQRRWIMWQWAILTEFSKFWTSLRQFDVIHRNMSHFKPSQRCLTWYKFMFMCNLCITLELCETFSRLRVATVSKLHFTRLRLGAKSALNCRPLSHEKVFISLLCFKTMSTINNGRFILLSLRGG